MISVEEALHLVLEHARSKPSATIASQEALGLVLAEEVASDVDSPPHDKSIVDGYAVMAADLSGGEALLAVLEEVVAGAVPQQPLTRGFATRIMTGAPIPSGADSVVMFEQTEAVPNSAGLGEVRFRDAPRFKQGQNILRQGASLRAGDIVLRPGHLLRAIETGLLAEVGRTEVRAVPRPSVAVLATGNELVPPSERPSAGQIRNSNGPMLAALVRQAGSTPVELGVARDDRQDLRRAIEAGLAADILVLSGGVSAGVLDLAPSVLAEMGVQQVFHKIRMKPGKPLWFGILPARPIDKLVFGLPGNPVSSLVCFELFVRPALAKLAGRPALGLPSSQAQLAVPYVHQGDRPTYHPAVLMRGPGQPTMTPLAWRGSADLRSLASANVLAYFPAGDRAFAAGELIDVLSLDG
jgi:molybdopterin molybdotransferase